MPLPFRIMTKPRPRALLRITAGALVLVSIACETPEDRLAGRYVRTWKEGAPPETGLDGEVERHVLVLTADRNWTSEHPQPSLQQFDVPDKGGTWMLQGVTLTLRPTDLGPMQYTVAGDTLFPRTPPGARQMAPLTGFAPPIGVDTYLLRER